MIEHRDIADKDLHYKIQRRLISFGGNRKLKIYGTLGCSSGKRLKRENRVFFFSEKEALQLGYRPCGHCLKMQYQNWKHELM
ncbi:Ada metal-binding domain-containing protein [Algoriphagus sp. D3-2-R+10]|uniref:Ada metal-binding domain-containing protein n=1 Tax=Algoriphagus aurantiacus TaxID=3103948 RepID=UPI002B398C10|nr:Ada metal-binding domain-containing protein [Algoriphagus sp. D3-2-R+10]MEB2774374.1 Ada metal-binding domain-containing protein [Algoriphagus sp. D3-2-R+10]